MIGGRRRHGYFYTRDLDKKSSKILEKNVERVYKIIAAKDLSDQSRARSTLSRAVVCDIKFTSVTSNKSKPKIITLPEHFSSK